MATLRQVIAENVGHDIATPEYFAGLGYDADALNDEAPLIGTCPNGINEAEVYMPSCGGYHISTQTTEFYQEEEPAGFKELPDQE